MIAVTAGAWFSLRRSHPELLPKLSEAQDYGTPRAVEPEPAVWPYHALHGTDSTGTGVAGVRAFGGTAVALLVTTRTLANVVRQTVAPVQIALWPELTRLDAVGAEPALRLGHRLLAIGSVALSAAFASALWFEGASVMAVWTQWETHAGCVVTAHLFACHRVAGCMVAKLALHDGQ